jgi:hypothetical protein
LFATVPLLCGGIGIKCPDWRKAAVAPRQPARPKML